MHVAIVCSDDPPGPETVVPADTTTFASVLSAMEVKEYSALCDLIDVPQLPDSSDERITADLPVLVLTGGLDVQTPKSFADDVVDALPNATHVVFPSGFHAQVGNLNSCAISILADFVEGPTRELDLACRSDILDLQFQYPAASK